MSQRPLRICMVTTFYPPYSLGGDGIFVWNLSNALARRGHHVEVIHCADAYRLVAGREPTATVDNHPNVTIHTLSSRLGPLSPLLTQQFGRPMLKKAAIRRVLDQGFDVIHYHNISLVGGPGVLAMGTGLKLYTPHEYWLVCPTHLLFKFNRAPCTSKSCLRCTLSHRRPPQWWRYGDLLPRSLQHVTALLAPSRWSAEVHASLGVPVVHLPLFVPEAAEAQAAEPVGSEPYFLFVGRLESLKGLHTILPLFLEQRRATLLVAGTGSAEPELRRLTQGSDRVRFLGQVGRDRLPALYRGAVALIVPSLCHEVSPLVIVEAFQQSTPVLARNRGGMPEMIASSGGGFVFEGDDLGPAIDRLLDQPGERCQLGRLGFEAYRRQWSEEIHLDRYLSLIGQLRVP